MQINARFLVLFLSIICMLSYGQNLNLLTTLEPGAIESSGLISINGKILSHNDSGGENALYEIDSATGNITRTVYIANAINVDWEDICKDANFIYIGDFGNNDGNRTNLKVYKVLINDYLNTPNDTVFADTISFNYADQVSFSSAYNNTNFDCEAMIAYDSLLYLFSKNWIDSKCKVYALSKQPGNYTIQMVDSFDSQGLITGACYNQSSNSIFLTAYGPPIPFVLRIENISTMPFSANYRIRQFVQMPNGTSSQIEAVFPINDHEYYISSEKSVLGDAMLATLDVHTLIGTIDRIESVRKAFPNPSNGFIKIDLQDNERVKIYDAKGVLVLETGTSLIDTKMLSSGVYQAVVYKLNNQIISSSKFLVN